MDSKFYETTAIKERKVIYEHHSRDFDKALVKTKADIMHIYPIGTPSFLSFEKASWVLTSDSIIAAKLSLCRLDVSEVIMLTGILGKHNEVISLHMTGTGLYGLRITMGGLLHPIKGGYRIIGVFTATVRDSCHVERVDLNISQIPSITLDDWVDPVIEEVRQKKMLHQFTREEKVLLSEPTEWIFGVPTPISFDVTFKVKLDGIKLPPMKGQLLLYRVEGLTEPKIGIILTTEGSIVPGWSAWVINSGMSHELDLTVSDSNLDMQQPSPSVRQVSQPKKAVSKSGNTKEDGVDVTAEKGHIRVTITSTQFFRQITWYVRSPKYPKNTTMVQVDKGTINLQVTNEFFSGTINAQGTLLEGKRLVSTFSAELYGVQQGGSLVKDITSYIGLLPFDGFWHDPLFGELNLSQKGEKINGIFSGGGTIKGIVTEKALNISWEKYTGDNGQGFLSAVGNGLLVGMTWNNDKNLTPETVVAVQVMLPAIGLDSEVGNVPTPKNDAEAQKLKYLGFDMYYADKYQEAARILLQVVTYFRDRAETYVSNLSSYRSYLVNQAIPLYTLISSAFEAGDYPTLMKSMSMAIDLQRKMGKGSADKCGYLEQAEKYIAELSKHAKTMDKLAAGFDQGLKSLSASGAGIYFKGEHANSGIKISSVLPGKPASKAGIIAGDLLMEIDGVPVAGISLEQVIIRLHGDAGTSVSIGLIRGEQSLKTKLSLATLTNLVLEHKKEVVRAISGIYNVVVNAIQDYRTDANTLNKTSNEIKDVSTAFEELIARITRRQKSIDDNRLAITALAEKCLAGSPAALDLFQRFILFQNKYIEDGKMDDESLTTMLKLDQDLEEFEWNPDASDVDRGLLKTLILTIGDLDQMRIEILGRLKIVKKTFESSSQIPNTMQIADSLSKLTGWLDKWRSRMVTDAAKIESLQFGQDFYESYIQTLLDLNLPEQALQASESGRARAFADLLTSGQKNKGNLGQAIYSKGVLFNPTSAPPLSVQEIKYIAAVQGGTLIEYFLLKDCIAIWVISPMREISAIRVRVKISRLEETIERLVELMGPNGLSSKGGSKLQPETAKLLRLLDESLIAPLAKRNLLPTDSKMVVTIIPHKCLLRVPFAALIDERNQYLIERHLLSYATALSVLKHMQTNPKGNNSNEKQRRLLALVSPDPLPNSEKQSQKSLLSLPKTAEIFKKYIVGFYSSEEIHNVYLGLNANEIVLREKASYADVLYFATHAEVNEKEPLRSFIALAKTNKLCGYFRVADVYSLNLQVELTILAACETGGGNISGDGVDGLSRAFTKAGSSALLMSLWEIPEEKTSLAMVGFHKFWLQKKMSKAVSLRNMQLELLKAYRAQPNLWAGFVLFGNPK